MIIRRSGTVMDSVSQIFPMSAMPPHAHFSHGNAWGYGVGADPVSGTPIPSIDGPNIDLPRGGLHAYTHRSAWGYDMTTDPTSHSATPMIDGPNVDMPLGHSGMRGLSGMVRDAGTGYYIDTATGKVWIDAAGTVPVIDESGAQVDMGTDSSSSWADIANSIKTLFLTGQQAIAQQKIIDLNMQLAQQGKPLVNAAMFQPSVGVNLQMGEQTKQMLLWGGVALLGIALLARRKG